MTGPRRPVLVAYDGSAASQQALTEAAELLRSQRVLVTTVWEAGLAYATAAMPPDGMTLTPTVDPDVAHEVDRGLHEHAERVSNQGVQLALALGLDAEPLPLPDEGSIAQTIIHAASEHQAAAIVVGSRGLSGLRARLEGSTSSALLKHAPCPVLVVHEHEQSGD